MQRIDADQEVVADARMFAGCNVFLQFNVCRIFASGKYSPGYSEDARE
jgi:hypothetical protein